MDHSAERHISMKTMNYIEFMVMIKDMSYSEFKKKMEENNLHNHNERMEFMQFMNLKMISNLMDHNVDVNEFKEFKFARDNNMSAKLLITLKRYLKGESITKISQTKAEIVSVEAIDKRINRAYKKIGVNSKDEARALVQEKYGLDFWFE